MTHAVFTLASNGYSGDAPKSDGSAFVQALCGVSCLIGAVGGLCYGLYGIITTEGSDLSLLVSSLVCVAVALVCAACCFLMAAREGSKSYVASNARFFQEMANYNKNDSSVNNNANGKTTLNPIFEV